MANWELKNCCKHDQVVFLATIGVFTVVILLVDQESAFSSTPPIRGAKVSMKKSYPMPGLREFESRWRLLLWRTFLLTPFKLITVFLHEASHAIAWLNNMLYFLPRE
ncbi:hypothetical protein CK203_087534 [Vitis vinifera]|uniref:Uncharacterized protein n=1 Tax=Vitis vinifera TaxID=29760 RepID=A0A438DA95_VITVI|nr:hypothetical protein CK203_087534 [Vitis vinifera]